MYYYVVVFILCLFMFSGTTVSTQSEVFYIDGYNSSNVQLNQTHIYYGYKNDELLNITCHEKGTPAMKLKWLQNEQVINGTEKNKTLENNIQLYINKSNDKDILTCHASEDETGLERNDIIINKTIHFILRYEGDTTTEMIIASNNLGDNVKNTDTLLEKLMKSRLFLIVAVVVIVLIILAAILACASKKSYRIKEDKVGLHPAVSQTSVFTTGSRSSPIISPHKITENKVPMHPVSSASYYNTVSRTLPIPPQTMTNDKIRMHPVSSASHLKTDSRTVTLPIPPHTNHNVGMHSSSYFNTNPRKPTSAQRKIQEECFYTNYDYNKTQLHGSREIIDEYQEPMDSQAYSYVQTQMYSEPERPFYTEPIPKILRKTKNTYVNYNKSNGSANIKNKNIDLYQNCEEMCDNEFDYSTVTS